MLGADELPRVAETLAAVGEIERGGVTGKKRDECFDSNSFSLSPVKGRVGVAWLFFYLLQPGALELGPLVAAAQTRPRLGRVIVIQLRKIRI